MMEAQKGMEKKEGNERPIFEAKLGK